MALHVSLQVYNIDGHVEIYIPLFTTFIYFFREIVRFENFRRQLRGTFYKNGTFYKFLVNFGAQNFSRQIKASKVKLIRKKITRRKD